MKKSIIIIVGIGLCLLIVGIVGANAQSMDKERMDRDLAVTSNVLKTLLNQDRNVVIWSGENSVEASYLENYGVVFSMPSNRFFFAPELARVREIQRDALFEKEKMEQEKEKWEVEKQKIREEQEREIMEEREIEAPEASTQSVIVSQFGGNSEDMVETIKTFLVDYSNLIGQLKPTDKIMVKLSSNSSSEFTFFMEQSNTVYGGKSGSSLSSIEVKVSDLNAYRSGKINRDEALKRVLVTEKEDIVIEEDIRLFSGILKTVYESSISKTYFMSDRPNIERLKDFGVIYHARFFSSNPLGFGDNKKHNMPTLKLNDISQADRDKKVTEMLGPFIDGLKMNLIEYGRTISSLENDESVVLKAKLTTCEGCGIPESIELRVKSSVLKDYSSGKLNKNSAVSKVTLKKVGEQ